ncbi:putative non-specific serine/threonine protein kinase [Rosa chinensis]|uniref:Putative non-specific serine/threonine protein kinase n=1 Tax=Rosa chinensis TaxID=74649 RepID=A0A2P6QNM2_ROSCH|nr:putative non-specific serine/threonine protein kinase [Rosa chinensis]
MCVYIRRQRHIHISHKSSSLIWLIVSFILLSYSVAYCVLLLISMHAAKVNVLLLSFALTLSSSPSSLNWTSDDCCRWQGINCNAAGWITHLSLPSKGLTLKQGTTFPSSTVVLGILTHLTHLNLSDNYLDQSVGSLLSLSHLEVLDLSSNLFSGELQLFYHLVSECWICPTINSVVQFHLHSSDRQARNLTSFRVSNNIFSGSIPSSLCLHSSPLISELDFSFNDFNGSLSSGLGECSKLKVFLAGYNNLSGGLPEDIYKAAKLEEIAIPRNSLDGVISDRIVNLTNLAILDLRVNQLRGVLPRSRFWEALQVENLVPSFEQL